MSGELIDSKERLITDERRKKIATFISDVLKPAKKTLDEMETQAHAIEEFESRDYQLSAWEALWKARESGADRGLIHLATGLGKTSVAVFDYAKFRKEQIDMNGHIPRALFVVHQNNILEQANERFGELLPDSSRFFYSNSQKELPKSEITFANFQMLYNGADRFPEDYFDYIIYDEAHHIEADTYKKVVDHFKPKFQLGLTATPKRMDEKDITDHFGEPLYSKGLPEAIAEGYLAAVNYNIIYDDAVREAMDSDFNPTSIAEIKRLFEIETRNEVIVEKIREAQEKIKQEQGFNQVKTIIFCADTEHADNVAELIGGMSYHSSKNSKEQDKILDAFRNNNLETITVRDMFNEGIDIPDARLIVFLRTTQSPTVFEQQLGRGLRKNSNKQEVTVLDFVANIERIFMVRELADNIAKFKRKHSQGATGLNKDDIPVKDADKEFKVNGSYSEFIFTKQIVNLLEKYKTIQERAPKWNAERLIAVVNDYFGNRYVTSKMLTNLRANDESMPDANAMYSIWNSVEEFNRARGIEIQLPPNLMSEGEITNLANILWSGKYATGKMIDEEYNEGAFVGQRWICARFGSVKKFNTHRGLSIDNKEKYDNLTDKEIFDMARMFSDGVALSQREIDILSKDKQFPSSSYIRERFGSITNFNRLRGIDVINRDNDYIKMSNDELIRLSLELSPDKKMTKRDIEQLSKNGKFCSDGTIMDRFGSINIFNEQRGFTEKDYIKMSNEELIELSLGLSPDRKMTKRDIVQLSKDGKFCSYSVIKKRFGSIDIFNELRGQYQIV